MPAIAGVPVNLAGAEAVAGLLMVGTISGVLLAMLMNNGGGAWDNAKKYIETGIYGGKRLSTHTKQPSSAIPSAIPSRTPPAPHSTFSSSCWPPSPLCSHRSLSNKHASL